MSNTAASLVDRVIASDLTLRQWVLTVPFELRLLLAAKPDALSAIGRIFIQEIQRRQRERARALGFERAEGAAVSFCQRFGSSLNLHVHWHVIVPDAFFVPELETERVDTVKLRAPARLDLEEIVTAVAARAIRWLQRHGYLESHGDDPIPSDGDAPWMRCLRGSERLFAAALTLRRREIGGASLASALVRFPFMTLKVIAAIHWQALRLWLRGCPTHVHPGKRLRARSP